MTTAGGCEAFLMSDESSLHAQSHTTACREFRRWFVAAPDRFADRAARHGPGIGKAGCDRGHDPAATRVALAWSPRTHPPGACTTSSIRPIARPRFAASVRPIIGAPPPPRIAETQAQSHIAPGSVPEPHTLTLGAPAGTVPARWSSAHPAQNGRRSSASRGDRASLRPAGGLRRSAGWLPSASRPRFDKPDAIGSPDTSEER
jgi:hypothetical protein